MKKILFIASAILILLSGCENFLDSELLTEKTTANFPETEKDAQEMVTAIYAHLLFESPETSSQYYIAQLAGDDCLGGNLSYSNNCATNFLMYSGNLNTFAGIWGPLLHPYQPCQQCHQHNGEREIMVQRERTQPAFR